jgi:hypothetical protein
VIYVVAADRRWIYTSYEKAYETFEKSMYEPGRPLRFMFLEKIFQLSMFIPPVDSTVKEEFWKYLLSRKSANPNELTEKLKKAEDVEEENFKKVYTEPDLLAKSKGKESDDPITKSAKRGAAIVRLASLELQTDIERRLLPFAPLVDSNPRLMKRAVNTYTMSLATELSKGTKSLDDTGKLAVETILSLRWPRLYEYLQEHRGMMDYIGNKTGPNGPYTRLPPAVKSKIPEDILNLFFDTRVIEVVKSFVKRH